MLSFKGRRAIWSMLGWFGIVVMGITTLVLLNDGSITSTWCVNSVCAAANGNFISDFNVMSVAPIALTFGECWVVILKSFHR